MPTLDPTPEQLVTAARQWLSRRSIEPASLEVLAGDVSPRRYLRLTGGAHDSAIIAYYPPGLRPAIDRFVATTYLLSEAGVPVPGLRDVDALNGFLMLEDAGPTTLYEDLDGAPQATVDGFLERAAQLVPRLRTIPREAVEPLGPALGSERLLAELEPTWELFLLPEGLVDGAEVELLRAALTTLCAALEAEGLVPTHRDLMARNLVQSSNRLMVLDHQDLCLAPRGYDLASLLNDSLFASATGERRVLSIHVPQVTTELCYRRCVVQRGLKAIGTFRRFSVRGVDRHLPLIPRALACVWRQFSQVPELSRVERETIALYVSDLNDCGYCVGSHQAVLRGLGAGEGGVALEQASAAMRPVLDFAHKLTLTPGAIDQVDIDTVRAAGWSDQAVEDIINVVSLFASLNRLVDGLGIAGSPAVFEKSGPMIAQHGYGPLVQALDQKAGAA